MTEIATPSRRKLGFRQTFFSSGISVFFQGCNDAPSLPSLIGKTLAMLDWPVRNFEVIVINDGRADNTGMVLDSLRQNCRPRLRMIPSPENQGFGGAIRTGSVAASKGLVF